MRQAAAACEVMLRDRPLRGELSSGAPAPPLPMTEPGIPAALDSGTLHRLPELRDLLRNASGWLSVTFAGLTWVRIGLAILLLVVFAIGRGSVRLAILSGQGFVGAAAASLTLTFGRFVPLLLFVVAAVNRGPRKGAGRIAWISAAAVVGEVVGNTICAFLLPLVAPYGYLAQLIDLDAPPLDQALHWLGLALTDVSIAAIVAASWYWFKRSADTLAALQEAERAREQTQQETAEARLMMMQAQIEPHFLFNTLASIRRLYETDRAAGCTMLRHLTSFLTASLPQWRADQSTLESELALASAYLSVQRVRMGHRLTVKVDVPDSVRAIEMPPMIVPTLVENAIIHGIGPLPEGGTISICARVKDDRLIIDVADDGRGLRDGWGAGVGLGNITARLHSRFGHRAGITLTSRVDKGVVATVELPLRSSGAIAVR
jgi:hypothetical protein